MGPHTHPEVSLHTHSLSDYVACLQRRDTITGAIHSDWNGVAALMLSSAKHVVGCGARVLICPDNTIHTALPLIRSSCDNVAWLHIADVVAMEAKTRGYKRVALLGTRWLVDSDTVYPLSLSHHNITCIRPTGDERNIVNDIIMNELNAGGTVKESSRRILQTIITRMHHDHQCDAVILGCTELPLIIDDTCSSLPTLDSTRLLARAALRYSLSSPPPVLVVPSN